MLRIQHNVEPPSTEQTAELVRRRPDAFRIFAEMARVQLKQRSENRVTQPILRTLQFLEAHWSRLRLDQERSAPWALGLWLFASEKRDSVVREALRPAIANYWLHHRPDDRLPESPHFRWNQQTGRNRPDGRSVWIEDHLDIDSESLNWLGNEASKAIPHLQSLDRTPTDRAIIQVLQLAERELPSEVIAHRIRDLIGGSPSDSYVRRRIGEINSSIGYDWIISRKGRGRRSGYVLSHRN